MAACDLSGVSLPGSFRDLAVVKRAFLHFPLAHGPLLKNGASLIAFLKCPVLQLSIHVHCEMLVKTKLDETRPAGRRSRVSD